MPPILRMVEHKFYGLGSYRRWASAAYTAAAAAPGLPQGQGQADHLLAEHLEFVPAIRGRFSLDEL
jgi:hypothetical protein